MISLLSGLLLIAGLSTLLAISFLDQHAEYSFTSYRYAYNLAQGEGFVYNPGDATLSHSASPLYILLLRVGLQFTDDLPQLGNLLGLISVVLAALAVFGLTYSTDSQLAAPLAAGLYAGFPFVWAWLGIEVNLWLALALIAIWLHGRKWGIPAAIMLALGTLVRPETAILGLAFLADSLMEGHPLRPLPAAVYGGLVTIALIWGLVVFDRGGPMPDLPPAWQTPYLTDALAASAFMGVGRFIRGLLSLSWFWSFPALLIIPASLRLKKCRPALVLAGWAILHILCLGILGVTVYPWTFAPLIPALVVLPALGLDWMVKRVPVTWPRFALAAVLILPLAGAVIHSYLRLTTTQPGSKSAWAALLPEPIHRNAVAAGAWLAASTPSDVLVGVTHDGVLGYVTDRHILDYGGTLQPDLADALRRGDQQWWLGEYAPDYVVLRVSEVNSLGGYSLADDIWFTANYAEVVRFDVAPEEEEPLVIFQRMIDPPSLTPRFVGMVALSDGLTLNDIATDFSLDPFETGRIGRLRLQWLVERTIPDPLYVAIRIQSRTGTIAALGGRELDFSQWPHRRLLTTYHALQLAPGLPPGVYDVQVGIGPDAFDVTWMPVTVAKIPFDDETFMGGVTGARADFGDIALLGYRLARTQNALDIALMWQALTDLAVDYRVLIQVRDEKGAVVVQLETEPRDGNYPTSVWSAGELVPDTYQLDITPLSPGSYQVFVSLLSPSGQRLLVLDGRDAVLVGFLAVLEENQSP